MTDVKKITLKYTASNIAKIEKATGMSLFGSLDALGKLDFPKMQFLVLAGGGTDEDFDALMASGFDNLIATVIEGLLDSGFLGKENLPDMSQIRAEMGQALQQALQSFIPSQTSGEVTNPQPSK